MKPWELTLNCFIHIWGLCLERISQTFMPRSLWFFRFFLLGGLFLSVFWSLLLFLLSLLLISLLCLFILLPWSLSFSCFILCLFGWLIFFNFFFLLLLKCLSSLLKLGGEWVQWWNCTIILRFYINLFHFAIHFLE